MTDEEITRVERALAQAGIAFNRAIAEMTPSVEERLGDLAKGLRQLYEDSHRQIMAIRHSFHGLKHPKDWPHLDDDRQATIRLAVEVRDGTGCQNIDRLVDLVHSKPGLSIVQIEETVSDGSHTYSARLTVDDRRSAEPKSED